MKKLVLTGLLVLSTMTFAAKITTTGKSWEKIEKENKVPEQEISIMNFSWLDKKDGVEGVYNTYSFKIGKIITFIYHHIMMKNLKMVFR